jgi:hypothetical protein
MLYRDYEVVVACVQRSELWSIDDFGQPRELLGKCPVHEGGYAVMYEVVDASGRRSVSQSVSIDDAMGWIDATIAAQEIRNS